MIPIDPVFNYSTGPVQASSAVLTALGQAPSTSHMPAGQVLVAETLSRLRSVLAVPDEFDVTLVPGSIRQTLETLIAALVPQGADLDVVAIEDGYWGRLIGELLRSTGNRSQVLSAFSDDLPAGQIDVITGVHMETETGRILPTHLLRAARAAGALSIIDIACTAPIHQLDYDACDIAVLGSHKCLAAAPGLGIVITRRNRLTFGDWALFTFLQDAQAKRLWAEDASSPISGPPPLPTYPLELVSSLRASLEQIQAEPDLLARSETAAKRLRDAVAHLGFRVHETSGVLSSCVTRLDLPADIPGDRIQQLMVDRGYFVIGNVGASSGSSIRIGTMSGPQCDPANIDGLVDALGDACAEIRQALVEVH